jgi:lipopolysaccharide/colanic/teichoic acid biosynthesis glycosyltransferase
LPKIESNTSFLELAGALARARSATVNSVPALFLRRHGRRWDLMRWFAEIAMACALLILTLPLMACVALAIKCESAGPVFEREARIARGRRFTLLTFRTKRHDPENLTPKWLRTTTAVGEFLRYTRIDLLPRLINVLRGEIRLSDDGTSLFWD